MPTFGGQRAEIRKHLPPEKKTGASAAQWYEQQSNTSRSGAQRRPPLIRAPAWETLLAEIEGLESMLAKLGVLSAITMLLVLTQLHVGVAEMTRADYRTLLRGNTDCGGTSGKDFRVFVARVLEERNFNFTVDIDLGYGYGPGYFDVKEALLGDWAAPNHALNDPTARKMDTIYHLTKTYFPMHLVSAYISARDGMYFCVESHFYAQRNGLAVCMLIVTLTTSTFLYGAMWVTNVKTHLMHGNTVPYSRFRRMAWFAVILMIACTVAGTITFFVSLGGFILSSYPMYDSKSEFEGIFIYYTAFPLVVAGFVYSALTIVVTSRGNSIGQRPQPPRLTERQIAKMSVSGGAASQSGGETLQQLEEGKGCKGTASSGGGFSGSENIEDAMENFEKGGKGKGPMSQ